MIYITEVRLRTWAGPLNCAKIDAVVVNCKTIVRFDIFHVKRNKYIYKKVRIMEPAGSGRYSEDVYRVIIHHQANRTIKDFSVVP